MARNSAWHFCFKPSICCTGLPVEKMLAIFGVTPKHPTSTQSSKEFLQTFANRNLVFACVYKKATPKNLQCGLLCTPCSVNKESCQLTKRLAKIFEISGNFMKPPAKHAETEATTCSIGAPLSFGLPCLLHSFACSLLAVATACESRTWRPSRRDNSDADGSWDHQTVHMACPNLPSGILRQYDDESKGWYWQWYCFCW